MYAIQGKINGATGFVMRPFNQTERPSVQCSDTWFHATLFKTEKEAEKAMDELTHGIAKCCRVVAVSITELANPAK